MVRPLPGHWVRSWVTALHGFEAQYTCLEPALIRASAYLNAGDEGNAQQALDLAKIECLSPEGTVLMRAVAEEFGISPLKMAVGTRTVPWGIRKLGTRLALFRRFGGAATSSRKSAIQISPDGPKMLPIVKAGDTHQRMAQPDRPSPRSKRMALETRTDRHSKVRPTLPALVTTGDRLWRTCRTFRQMNLKHQSR